MTPLPHRPGVYSTLIVWAHFAGVETPVTPGVFKYNADYEKALFRLPRREDNGDIPGYRHSPLRLLW